MFFSNNSYFVFPKLRFVLICLATVTGFWPPIAAFDVNMSSRQSKSKKNKIKSPAQRLVDKANEDTVTD